MQSPSKTSALPAVEPKKPEQTGLVVPSGRSRRTGIVILILCIVIAVAITLLVPMIIDGAQMTPGNAAAQGRAMAEESVIEFTSFDELSKQAGFVPNLPAALPEGAIPVALSLRDERVVEIGYWVNSTDFALRIARGREDISGVAKEYAVSFSEQVGGTTRTYSGTSESIFNLCVWSSEGYSYAVISADGLPADMMRIVAESVG